MLREIFPAGAAMESRVSRMSTPAKQIIGAAVAGGEITARLDRANGPPPCDTARGLSKIISLEWFYY
jgi:hypothetical protein